jgi:hypothetical protein
MQDPTTLKSGHILTVSLAPFSDANKLLKTVARELTAVSFDLDLGNVDLAKIAPKDINTLKNAAFQLLQSEAVETALFKCMERCLYDGQRITRETFDGPEARADFLPVAWEVMKENLTPFFKNLGFASSISEAPQSNAPKSR